MLKMVDKKDFHRKIILICIVVVLIIIIMFYKNESEEYFISENNIENFVENELILNENILTKNEDLEKEKIKIYITGEVNNPGVKELEYGARIEDAINSAGGITLNANIKNVNFAYQLEDGQKIYIPNINEKIEEYITIENGDGIIDSSKRTTSNRVNINKANSDELCKIPGVGESLAMRIINYREENGKFKTIDDLKNVSGIGEKKFEGLKEYVVVK